MAEGKRTAGGGGGRGRKKPADAVIEGGPASGHWDSAKRAGSRGGAPLRPVSGADGAKGHGELAQLRVEADLQSTVRRPVRSPLKALAHEIGLDGSGGLTSLLPVDVKKIGREEMAKAFLHMARQAEKVGQIGPMINAMTKVMTLMGYDEAPPEQPQSDPEERKRRIMEAAASYGMVLPGPADG
jgi:hypothetical protein